MDDIPIDKVVTAYLNLRDAKALAEEEHKVKIDSIERQMEVLSDKMLEFCNDNNMETVRTAMGTISRRVKERYWCTDWEAMHEFVLEHEAPYLLERRINTATMKQFLEENPGLCPIGLQSDRKYAVVVRKPNKK